MQRTTISTASSPSGRTISRADMIEPCGAHDLKAEFNIDEVGSAAVGSSELMRSPEISYITFTLPEGLEAPDVLRSLGARLGTERGRATAMFEVDLAARPLEELRDRVMTAIAPGDAHVSMRVHPTDDPSRPLHEQMDRLPQSRKKPLSLGYYVVATGWGLCVLASSDKAITISCSYLEDALGGLVDLGRAALDSAQGRCSFAEEPGEYRWVFCDERLRVLEFGELWGHKPDDKGELVFEAPCSSLELARAILRCAADVEHRYGARNYELLWHEHPFPKERVEQLKQLIRDAEKTPVRRG